MARLPTRFATGFLVGLVSASGLSLLFPAGLAALLGRPAARLGIVSVEEICQPDRGQCAYLRTEQRIGINDVPFYAIYWRKSEANWPSLTDPRVVCDSGAELDIYWQADELVVQIRHGGCQQLLRGAYPAQVRVVER